MFSTVTAAKPTQMGRFVLIFSMILWLQWSVATSLAQDSAAPEGQPRAVPTIRGVESSGSENQSETSPAAIENKLEAEVIPSKTITRRSKSLTEELFSNPLNFVLILIVFVYIFLMFMQPKTSRKEQKDLAEKLKNLKKNDRVVTSSGIHGVVANINAEADTITLRVDENTNTKLTIDRMSIRSVVS
jgi:preprotein translocase YajC subunit